MEQRYPHLTAGHLGNNANTIEWDTGSIKLAHEEITKVEKSAK